MFYIYKLMSFGGNIIFKFLRSALCMLLAYRARYLLKTGKKFLSKYQYTNSHNFRC